MSVICREDSVLASSDNSKQLPTAIECIIKRDGREVPFDEQKIADAMRKAFDAGNLDYIGVYKIMTEEKPNQRPTYRLKYEVIKAYFKPGASDDMVLRDILKGLELLKKQRARENREAR